jgi:nucleotide-binding universal stress UspA family protein
MIKDIIVALSSEPGSDVAADYAISAAAALQTHLSAVAFAYEPVIPQSVMGGISMDFVDAQRAENEQAAAAAVARFEAAAAREGLSADSRTFTATLAGAADVFGGVARRSDLAIVGQNKPDKGPLEEFLIEGALFESGRPVVVVPYIQKAGLKLDRVVCCWDGSRTAARAIADALPLLKRARAIDLLVVTTDKIPEGRVPGADMGAHLARHGLNVDVKRLASADVDVANTILSYVADSSADFIVMGGYGHSRLREFILGGATRGVLSSMTVPTLMSH